MARRPETLLAAAEALRAGTSAAELHAAQVAAGDARADELACFTWRDREPRIPDDAPPPSDQAPLWGLGGVVKANLCVAGRPTDCGSRLLRDWRPPYDASAVARLRRAGAVLLGGTVMDEFGMGASTEHAATGPARNPHDPTRTPGGSSGGAAAAVAAGLAWFALGTDTGGSVRQPAHCCGLVGLRPTWGRVSRHGLVAFASSLDQIGPLARTVDDCAAVFGVIAGRDPRDATSRDAVTAALPSGPWRLGVPRAHLDLADEDTRADFARVLDALRVAGAELVDVELPDPRDMLAAYHVLSTAEASANLARFDGVAYGARVDGDDYAEMLGRTRAAGFGREVKRRILLGVFVLSAGQREACYERAQAARRAVRRAHLEALSRCDLVVSPTAPTAAFPLGARLDDPLEMYAGDAYTVGAALAGLPALSVPTGRDRDGLPLSLHLVGPADAEARLFAAGRLVERLEGREGGRPWS